MLNHTTITTTFNTHNQAAMAKEPVIICISHQKGGVGKSMLSLTLSEYFNTQGDKCAIVDIDEQGTITDIFASFGDSTGKILGGVHLLDYNELEDITELRKRDDYDLIIIDTPPYIFEDVRPIFSISDCILIPTKPSVNDYLAIHRTIDLVLEAISVNPFLKFGIIINMNIKGSSFSVEIRKELNKQGVKVFDTEIGQRVEFTRYHLQHETIFKTNDQKAQDEISKLGAEVFDFITSTP